MGFKRKLKQFRLVFDDEDMKGFECLARSTSIQEFAEISLMTSRMMDAKEASGMDLIFIKLSEIILEWNLEDDAGEPVPVIYAQCKVSGKPGRPGEHCGACPVLEGENTGPCSYTGLCEYDINFAMTIFTAWMEALASVDSPLLSGLNNGKTTQEDITTKLANMSQSLPS